MHLFVLFVCRWSDLIFLVYNHNYTNVGNQSASTLRLPAFFFFEIVFLGVWMDERLL